MPRRATALRRTSFLPRPRFDPDALADRRLIREAVFARDRWTCLLAGVEGAGPCFGMLTVHHRRKASGGGAYRLNNLATLCALHNDALESDADVARIGVALILVVRRDHPDWHACG